MPISSVERQYLVPTFRPVQSFPTVGFILKKSATLSELGRYAAQVSPSKTSCQYIHPSISPDARGVGGLITAGFSNEVSVNSPPLVEDY
jgi:hypothetical protein